MSSNISSDECDDTKDNFTDTEISGISETDSEDDSEKYLPNAKAWGKEKYMYFGTDYVDKDFRKTRQDEEELALAEEEEASKIQQRLLSNIDESILALPEYKPKEREKLENLILESNEFEVDISALSEKEKISTLERRNPEMIASIKYFKDYFLESIKLEKLLSYTNLSDLNAFQSSPIYRFIKLKYICILRYCSIICFYFSFKTCKKFASKHPVSKSLLLYRKMLKEMELIENNSCIKKLLEQLYNKTEKGETIEISNFSKNLKDSATTTRKKVSFDSKSFSQNSIKNTNVKDKLMERQYGDLRDVEADEMSFSDEEEEEEGEEEESTERPITYQIAKNKGLMPKRKKEQRNPRVKNRMKYKKALARRKGQVRQPVKEIKKYSGEIFGIRSSVVKSVKFK